MAGDELSAVVLDHRPRIAFRLGLRHLPSAHAEPPPGGVGYIRHDMGRQRARDHVLRPRCRTVPFGRLTVYESVALDHLDDCQLALGNRIRAFGLLAAGP